MRGLQSLDANLCCFYNRCGDLLATFITVFKLLVQPTDEPVEGQGVGSLVVESKSSNGSQSSS
ncbi:MAG: hypothetical protein QF702_08655 [Prochlorococcaceae cyanobacterium ETNP2_MAG_10]|nr:hypothetical protein [Prochlorococcaceae cyanobacterium ETNP2_MAG_10]